MLKFADFISENILVKDECSSVEEYLTKKGFIERAGLWNYEKDDANIIIEQKNFDLLIDDNGNLKFNIGKVRGSFIMDPDDKTKKLKSLKGFEHIDCHTLDLSNNEIESIGKIGHFISLNLSGNLINNIIGLQENILGYLDLSNNKITSLIGGPKHIKSFFDVTDNPLTNLEGFPNVYGTAQVSESIETFYGLQEFNRSINLDKNFKNISEEEISFLKSLSNEYRFKNYCLELIQYTIENYGSSNVANLNIPDKEINSLPEDIKYLIQSSKGLKKFNI